MRRLDDGGREASWEATGVPRQREMEPQAQVVRVGGGTRRDRLWYVWDVKPPGDAAGQDVGVRETRVKQVPKSGVQVPGRIVSLNATRRHRPGLEGSGVFFKV